MFFAEVAKGYVAIVFYAEYPVVPMGDSQIGLMSIWGEGGYFKGSGPAEAVPPDKWGVHFEFGVGFRL